MGRKTSGAHYGENGERIRKRQARQGLPFFVSAPFKRRPQQCIPIGQLQGGVAEHGGGAVAGEAGGVVVDLDFVEHVHVGFAGQFGGGKLPEGDVDVVAALRVKN